MLITSITAASAQSPKRTNRFPVGTFHKKNQNINGLSVGLYSGYGDFGDSMRNVTSNGIRLEVLGGGILVPLIPSSPISDSEEGFKTMMATPASERINGFNLSPAGTVCDCIVNGISAGLIGQINRQVSGVSASLVMNLVERHNGIQIAMFNESYAMNGLQIGLSNYGNRARGLQIGLFNQSKNFKGIQLGLWNRNQKRKLPILNWNFRD
jgi:hypothetical protein